MRVEEYKRPTFEVTLADRQGRAAPEPARHARRRGRATTSACRSRAAACGGASRAQPVYPWWWWLVARAARGRAGADDRDAAVAALGDDGTLRGRVHARGRRAPQRRARTSRTATRHRRRHRRGRRDALGRPRSFRLGFVTVEARIEMPQAFFRDGEPAEAHAWSRADLDGAPRAGKGRWRLLRARGSPETALMPAGASRRGAAPGAAVARGAAVPHARATRCARAGDGYVRRGGDLRTLDRRRRARPRRALTHDAKGEAKVELADAARRRLPPALRDHRRLRRQLRDGQGLHRRRARDPARAAGAPSGRGVRRCRSAARRALLALSGLPGQPLLLDIFRAGELVERRLLIAGTDAILIEIPVTEDGPRRLRRARSPLLRDHQFIAAVADRSSCRGTTASSSCRSRPSATGCVPATTETWRVTVKGAGGTGQPRPAPPSCSRTCTTGASTSSRRTSRRLRSRSTRIATRGSQRRAPASAARQGSWSRATDFAHAARLPLARSATVSSSYDGYGIGGPGRRGVRMSSVAAGQPARTRRADGDDEAGRGCAGGGAGGVAEGEVPAATECDKAGEPVAEEARVSGGEARAPPASRRRCAATSPRPRSGSRTCCTDADGTAAIEFTVPDSVTVVERLGPRGDARPARRLAARRDADASRT